MTYLVFETELEALEAEAKIVQNIREFLTLANSERLTVDGLLLGRDFHTQEITEQGITTRWAVPVECEEGWAFPKPTSSQVSPIPSNVVLSGVGGIESEYINPINHFPELPT